MAGFDPKKWTAKTQEAFSAAIDQARGLSNPELTPDHVLAALVRQDDTIVPAVLQEFGLAPLMVRNRADEAVAKLPHAYGGGEPRMSREMNNVIEVAQQYQTRPEGRLPLGRTPAAGDEPAPRRRLGGVAAGAARGARLASRHVAESGGAVPGAGALRAGPHAARP